MYHVIVYDYEFTSNGNKIKNTIISLNETIHKRLLVKSLVDFKNVQSKQKKNDREKESE